MRMRGHRLRSGVKRAGNRAGSPALMLAVTMPIHSARPISTAATAHMRRQRTQSLLLHTLWALSEMSLPDGPQAGALQQVIKWP